MNGRKARQLRSQGGQKRLRRYRKDVRAAEDTLRAEQAEANAAGQEQYDQAIAALAEEPQFAVVNPFSGETIVIAAQSMIWPLGVNGKGDPLDPEVAAASDEALERFQSAVASLPEVTSEENPDAENHRIEQETAEYFHGDEGREPPKIIAPKGALTEEAEARPDVKVILPGTAEALGIEQP